MLPWLRRETIIALHERHLQDWPTAAGVRNEAALNEALAYPKSIGNNNPVRVAAAYGFVFCSIKPFNGGNKHVAFGACVTFLELSGLSLTAPSIDIIRMFNDIEAEEKSEADLAAWLKVHVLEK
jgi:death on curing protein